MTSQAWTPVLNIPSPGNVIVVPNVKIVYVSVTKVACTTLRWMLADLAGEDPDSFHTGLAAHQTRLMTIHRGPEHWQHAIQLFRIPWSERTPISRDNGWLVFAVVRDPWSRLWSAWESKFLVQHARYKQLYGDEPWFPRVPSAQAEIVEDFRRFVDAAPWLSNERLATDVHFLSQTYSVRPQGINYSRIYDLARLDELFDDVHLHLKELGEDRELYLPRANETPLPLIPAVLEGGVAEEIQRLYAEDFANFGDRWSLDTVKMRGDSWSDDAIAHAAFHTVANERIGDLSRGALKLRRELKGSERRAARLELEVGELRSRLVPRARRAGRRLLDRAKGPLSRD